MGLPSCIVHDCRQIAHQQIVREYLQCHFPWRAVSTVYLQFRDPLAHRLDIQQVPARRVMTLSCTRRPPQLGPKSAMTSPTTVWAFDPATILTEIFA